MMGVGPLGSKFDDRGWAVWGLSLMIGVGPLESKFDDRGWAVGV